VARKRTEKAGSSGTTTERGEVVPEIGIPRPKGMRVGTPEGVRRAMATVVRLLWETIRLNWDGGLAPDAGKTMMYALTQLSSVDAKLYERRYGESVEEIEDLLEQLRRRQEEGHPGMHVVRGDQ